LAALIAAALTPIGMMVFGAPLDAMLALVLAVFIVALHRDNIRRIATGRESRIGERA
jgi:glycerol-3-phosphate acyltransferase PlsY